MSRLPTPVLGTYSGGRRGVRHTRGAGSRVICRGLVQGTIGLTPVDAFTLDSCP